MNKSKVTLLVLGLIAALALVLSGVALAKNSDNDGGGAIVKGAELKDSDGTTILKLVDGQQQCGLTVTGTGKVDVTPDIALLSLGVEYEAKTVAEAQAQANQSMNAIMAALSANGIADKDIQTSRYSIEPVWNYTTGYGTSQRIFEGYRVSNMVKVTVREVANAGTVIDAVTEAGGNQTVVQSISFTIDDSAPYEDQARELAIKNAMAKAAQMASVAGVSLGKIVNISESGSYIPVSTQAYYKDAAEAAGTSISSGQLEVSSSVQLVYSLD